jgi:hypothetical protein
MKKGKMKRRKGDIKGERRENFRVWSLNLVAD